MGPTSNEGQEGLTLVELLVVMVLMGVVGGIVTGAIITGMNSARTTTDRINATQELEIGLQRVTRDLRAADPLVLSSHDAYEDELGASILSGGERRTVTYQLDGEEGEQRFLREDTGQILVALVDNGGEPVFRYFDREGDEIECSEDCESEYLKARHIEVRLIRDMGQEGEIEVSTRVGVRNIRYEDTEES